jgi:hypothetical protein
MAKVKECLPGDDNDRDIILFTPEVKVLESGVKADIYHLASSQSGSDYELTIPK